MKILGIIMMILAVMFGIIEAIKNGTINNITLFLYLMGLGIFEVSTHD